MLVPPLSPKSRLHGSHVTPKRPLPGNSLSPKLALWQALCIQHVAHSLKIAIRQLKQNKSLAHSFQKHRGVYPEKRNSGETNDPLRCSGPKSLE